MSDEEKAMEDGNRYLHLREVGKLRAKAIKVALKLQAKVYEQRLDDHEKRISEASAKASRILWVAAGVSVAASILVTALGLAIGVVGVWLSSRK